jgi:hypothetical protein
LERATCHLDLDRHPPALALGDDVNATVVRTTDRSHASPLAA